MRTSRILFLLIALLISAEGARLWWYSGGQPTWEGKPVLNWSPPPGAENLGTLERAAHVLSYDRAVHVQLEPDQLGSWVIKVIYLEYEAGNGHQWRDLFTHTPDVCFPASGAEMLEVFEARTVSVDGQDLLFKPYLFRYPHSPELIYTFKMVWMADMERYGMQGSADGWRQARIGAVRARSVFPPGRQILAIVTGVTSEAKAWELMKNKVVTGCQMTAAP